MSKKRFGRPRLQARPKHHKQAGAVEEALRCRGVIAHVKPSWTGSLIVQVADPDATAGYLDAHAEALADALLADSVFISSGLRDFIVAPEWRGPDDIGEIEEEEAAWPTTDDPQPEPDQPAAQQAAPARPSLLDTLDAFMHGYRMGRLAGVLDDLRRHLVLSGPQDDGSFELRLHADCNSDAVRAQLCSRSAATLAPALRRSRKCRWRRGPGCQRLPDRGHRPADHDHTRAAIAIGRGPGRIAPPAAGAHRHPPLALGLAAIGERSGAEAAPRRQRRRAPAWRVGDRSRF